MATTISARLVATPHEHHTLSLGSPHFSILAMGKPTYHYSKRIHGRRDVGTVVCGNSYL